MKVLYAEDNMTTFKLMRIYLNVLDVEYDGVVNGAKAVEFVRKTDYDLVLMDLMMPVLDGYDAIIKILELKSNINIVVLTACTISGKDKDQRIIELEKHIPIENIYQKPITCNKLKKIIKNAK